MLTYDFCGQANNNTFSMCHDNNNIYVYADTNECCQLYTVFIVHLSGLLIGRTKKSNFVGFLGTKSQKNRPISGEFSGQTWLESKR